MATDDVDGPMRRPCEERARPGLPTNMRLSTFSSSGLGLVWDEPEGGVGVRLACTVAGSAVAWRVG